MIIYEDVPFDNNSSIIFVYLYIQNKISTKTNQHNTLIISNNKRN